MIKTIRLRIADTIISLRSDFSMQPVEEADDPGMSASIAKSLLYAGRRPADMRLLVRVGHCRWRTSSRNRLFLVSGQKQGGIGWSLYPQAEGYLLQQKTPIGIQQARMNKDFRFGEVILPDDGTGTWNLWHLVYNPLQIVLLNYLALRGGVFLHGTGVIDTDGRGYIFCGRPGAGKSTLAGLWLRHSKARVVADDRVIVRRVKGVFRMYGSCWHSSCPAYLSQPLETAAVSDIFFLSHGRAAALRPMGQKQALRNLWSSLFVSCWNRTLAQKQVSLCERLLRCARFWSLAFPKDRKVIDAVRAGVRR